MNKVFRVIWNASSQSWVAVSEISRLKGKTKSSSDGRVSSSNTSVISTAFALLFASSTTIDVYADTTATTTNYGQGSSAVSGRATAFGANANASGASVSVGYNATTGEAAAVAIGAYAEASATGSTAIGGGQGDVAGAKAKGFHSIAIGETTVSAHHGIGIGRNSKAEHANSVALGTYSATRAVSTVNATQYQSFDDKGNVVNANFSGIAANSGTLSGGRWCCFYW